jgi:putative ABC transport system permease protein
MLIGSIAGISLLVGGIGILAIMLIAIRERTNEIGLRRAVGASRKDIMTQFVLEASILSVGGGLVGIFLGILGAIFVRIGTSWAVSISPNSVAFAFFFSLLIGMFFGVYPARRASLLDPITALRSE